VDYGYSPEEVEKLFETLRAQIPEIGQREVARESGVSRRTVARVIEGKTVRSDVTAKLISIATQKTEHPSIGAANKKRGKPQK
jgi:transcriptional regulator with XRE-family HTH domain